MQTDQERSEQIERYLAGEMPETERQAFETALAEDSGLAEALALHRALRDALGHTRRRQLLDALADVTEAADAGRPAGLSVHWFRAYRVAAAAAVLLLITALGVWWYVRPGQPDNLPMAVEQPALPPVSAPQPVPAPSTPSAPPAPDPEPRQLALAERAAFTPNPTLDPMIGTYIRGGNGSVRVTQPRNDAVLPLHDGKVRFALAGYTADASALTLQLYNNRETDFAAGKPVFSANVPVQDSLFSWQSSIRLTPGRYYALLTAPDEEEPLLVLRFFVGRKE